MIVVVGMAFEARIAAGLGVPVICGGDGTKSRASLARAMAAGCGGLISFGVAGGLAPDLKPGTCVIGSAILDDEAQRPTDARWAQRLMRIIPGSVYGPIAGVREPIAHAADKRAPAPADRRDRGRHGIPCGRATRPRGTACRSRRSAWWSIRSSAPFRARRSPARAPTARSIRSRSMRSLLRYPRDLVGLIRMSLDARAARATLVRGSDAARPRARPARHAVVRRCARARRRSGAGRRVDRHDASSRPSAARSARAGTHLRTSRFERDAPCVPALAP